MLRRRLVPPSLLIGAIFAVASTLLVGCGPSPAPRVYGLAALDAPAPRGLEFAGILENRRDEPYAPLARPSSVLMLPDNTLFFSDAGTGRVHIFDPDLEYVGVVGSPGAQGFVPLDLYPHGFMTYVLEGSLQQILRYSKDGAFRDVLIDIDALDPNQTVRASAFTADRDGRLAICDYVGHRVAITGPFLELASVVGEYGSFLGQFNQPWGCAFGPTGVLYVSDRGNARVQVFDQTGQALVATEGLESAEPLMGEPLGLDTDRYGNVFVCDPGKSVLHVLAPDLHPLLAVGGDDFAPDHLRQPVDCFVGPDDRVYVVDLGREALMVYDIVYP